MTTAFVTGATGFTGREVVRALRERSVDTVAHVRPDSSRLSEWRERFEALGAAVDTTPWELDAMRETFEEIEPDLVFCLVGTTSSRTRASRRTGGARETFESVDFGLRALLVDALQALGARPRFIELSSVGVGPRSPSSYLRLRWRTEEYIRDSGLPYTIARPGFITGPGRDDRRPLEYAAAAVVNAMAVAVGAVGLKRFGGRFRSITNVDLARALVRAGLDPAWENRVLEGPDLRALARDEEATSRPPEPESEGQ